MVHGNRRRDRQRLRNWSWSATGSCTVRVRSTDAAPSTPLLRVVLGQLTELIGHARPASEGGGQVADGGAAEPGADSVHRPVQGPARGAGRRAGAPGEIGRASCRERG